MGRFSRRRSPISAEYVATSPTGDVDQVLTFTNHTESGLVPTLRYTARDFYGRDLPHVVTTTVHGTDRGEVLVPPGSQVRDVLHFAGPGHRNVRGVDVGVDSMQEVEHPPLEGEVSAVMLDLEQHATLDPDEFWGIGVANPNPFGVQVRISLVAWEERVRDHPRQAADVVTLQDDLDLASASHEVIWLPEDVRGQFHAVEHHLVPQTFS